MLEAVAVDALLHESCLLVQFDAALRPSEAVDLAVSSVTLPRAHGTRRQFGHVTITLAPSDLFSNEVTPITSI